MQNFLSTSGDIRKVDENPCETSLPKLSQRFIIIVYHFLAIQLQSFGVRSNTASVLSIGIYLYRLLNDCFNLGTSRV